MKIIALFLTSMVFILGSIGIALSAKMNLAGAWSFDEGSGRVVKDSVGGKDGEIKGSLKWVDGKLGRALQFPGKGDSYVSIPHADFMDADPYTIVAWIKLEPLSWQYVFWKDGTEWPEKHLKRHIDMWIHDGDYPVLMWHVGEGGGDGRLDGKTIVADGKWHHVAQWSDSKNMRLYIDGKMDGEAPINGKLVKNGEDPLWIGARPGDVAATGIIDEVGFFTKALTDQELKTVMEQSLSALAAVEYGLKLATSWGQIKFRK